ncbi:hypothetical protein F4810DRAFT_234277 [Camillea tinctor]|nr:hypothetical protein F4810DRAFT_234277 [Camillea tinctor]
MGASEDLFNFTVVGVAILSIAIGLRLWTRVVIRRSFGWDDAALSVSFIGYILFASFTLAALHYGFGTSPVQPWFDPQKAHRYMLAGQISYVLTACTVKISIGLVLLRINIRRSITIILIILMVFVTISTLVIVLILVLQCRPLSLYWGVGKGTCLNWETIIQTAIALSVCGIISQCLLSLLPIPMLWNVQISRFEKVSISALLGLGIVSSIATLVRFKYIFTASDGRDINAGPDSLTGQLISILWSNVEVFLSMLATSLVACRPALKLAVETVSMSFVKTRSLVFNNTEGYRELLNLRQQESDGESTEMSSV